jgi:TetR/AcrR family fatty acid metabolism transcriptional regulator
VIDSGQLNERSFSTGKEKCVRTRTRGADERRNQILDASEALFAQKGYHAATMRDIAHAAGIAAGSLYLYFDGKPALLIALFQRLRTAFLADRPSRTPEPLSDAESLRALLLQPLAGLRRDRYSLFRILVSEMLVNADLRARFRDEILAPPFAIRDPMVHEDAQALGLLGADGPAVQRLITSLVLGLALSEALGDAPALEEDERVTDAALALLARALRPANPMSARTAGSV